MKTVGSKALAGSSPVPSAKMKAPFTIGAFGMIFDEKGRILLCHRRDHDIWNIPGGGVETGESPWEAVKREVKEETGFDSEIIKLIGVYTKPDKDDVVFSFLCKIVGGEKTLNDEADGIEYFSLNDIPSNMLPRQVERIKDAQSNTGDILLKIQPKV